MGGEMKLSKFGFGFELSGFVAFLAWDVSLLSPGTGWHGLDHCSNGFPDIIQRSRNPVGGVVNLMEGFGSAFLVIAVGFFLMNFFPRKKNKENDFKGVKKIITVMCSICAGLRMCLYFVPLVWFMYEILNGILVPRHFSLIILFPSVIFNCLLLHGIKNERSGFVKPFLIFHYTLFVLIIASVAVTSIWCAAYYGMFTIVLCGLLYIMILTFIFVFNIGFYVALQHLPGEGEKPTANEKEH